MSSEEYYAPLAASSAVAAEFQGLATPIEALALAAELVLPAELTVPALELAELPPIEDEQPASITNPTSIAIAITQIGFFVVVIMVTLLLARPQNSLSAWRMGSGAFHHVGRA